MRPCCMKSFHVCVFPALCMHISICLRSCSYCRLALCCQNGVSGSSDFLLQAVETVGLVSYTLSLTVPWDRFTWCEIGVLGVWIECIATSQSLALWKIWSDISLHTKQNVVVHCLTETCISLYSLWHFFHYKFIKHELPVLAFMVIFWSK
jgi:hypothetical protein